MKKIYAKLIAITLTLMLSVSVLVASSYAWLVIAAAPEAEGMQITIGGGNTILVAADLSVEKDGKIYHYPDWFSSTVDFSQHKSYAYLNELGGLTPVSTADGLSWFVPQYYDLTDDEVVKGSALAGALKPLEEFLLDTQLSHANLAAGAEEEIAEGSYAYLDFWVVSPSENYTLRVSTGEESGGSFVIGLQNAEQGENGYVLSQSSDSAAAAIRVGFLANPDLLSQEAFAVYEGSPAYDKRFELLKGAYTEPSGLVEYDSPGYRFTIYEPNGDYHPNDEVAQNGSYRITTPVGVADGQVTHVDIRDRLTVQKKSSWVSIEGQADTLIEQRFAAAAKDPAFAGLTAEEMTEKFYKQYVGSQVGSFVNKGEFIKNTANLYTAVVAGDVTGTAYDEATTTAGATDDVFIVELEKNVPQRIRMFVWIEGEDVDCVGSTAASSLAFSIELAGSNMDT